MEGRSMSRRKLPELKPTHQALMQHIADFVMQCTNIIHKTFGEHQHFVLDVTKQTYFAMADYINKCIIALVPNITPIKDDEGRIRSIGTDDNLGQLPLLTAEELEALKLFLADYRKQISIANSRQAQAN